KVLPDYTWDLVEPAVRTALTTAFGFAARSLGEPAYLSEVVSAIQRVDGVDYVEMDVFGDVAGDTTPVQLVNLVDDLTGVKTCVSSVKAFFDEVTQKVERETADTLTLIAQRHGLSLDELVALNPELVGADLSKVPALTVYRGIRPAQLAVLPDNVP